MQWNVFGNFQQVLATLVGKDGVNPMSDTNGLGGVSSRFPVGKTTLTRPANTTAYTANDAVTDTGGAASVVTMSDTNDNPVTLEAIRIDTVDTGPGTAGGSFECWVYNGAVTPAADNAAFTNTHAGFVGRFSGTWIACTDGSFIIMTPVEGSRRVAYPIPGAETFNLIFKTLLAFTPSAVSTVLNIAVEGFQGRV